MSKIVNISDVFISYSRRNTAFARKLEAAFKERNMKVWADWEDIPKGADWRAEIGAGVEGADAFLFVISPDSVKSSECRHEVELALANRKRFVPVLHVDLVDDESKTATHPAINAHNWIFARETDNWDAALEEIIKTVKTDLDHVRAHTRLNVRAREWDASSRDNSFLLTGKEIQEAEAWLAQSGEKEPQPTQLHNDYIFASRAAEIKRQRRILSGVVVALIVSVALTILAVVQSVEAERQRGIAVRSAEVRQSVALASGAREATTYDQTRAIALALEAVQLDDPPALAQRVLGEVAYRPGPVQVLSGHTDAVTSIAYSHDGRLALSGSDDKLVMLWDMETGEPLRVFEGHDDDINGVAFNPDGTIAASASSDDTIILWDVETGDMLRQLEMHDDRVLALAFSPDGTKLVSASRDETLIIWDVASGEPLLPPLEGHNSRVFSVAYSPDGGIIASGADDGQIFLWDAAAGEQVGQLTGHQDVVNSLAFNPSGETLTLVSASSDRTLILWDVEARTSLRTLLGHGGLVRTADFSPDGKSILSGGDDQTIILWNAANGEVINTFTGLDFIRVAAFAPDSATFLANAPDGNIFLWDVRLGNVLREIPAQSSTSTINAVAYSPDGTLLASGGRDQAVVVSDAASGESIHNFDELPNVVQAITFSPDSQFLAAGLEDGSVLIWNIAAGEIVITIPHGIPMRTLAFSPDGALLAGGDAQLVASTITLWDAATGAVVSTLKGHGGDVLSLDFSPDGKLLASGSFDNTVKVWDVENGQVIHTFSEHTLPVKSVAFTPDGSRLLSASYDETIRLWDVAGGTLLNTFTGHSGWIHSVAVSPDGQSFVSASDDQLILLWDINGQDPIRSFAGHLDDVHTLAFAPDGKSFISGGVNDGRVMQWRVDTLPELIAWADAHRYASVLDCNTRRQFELAVGDDCL